jgi:hypothetical protein
MLSDAKLAEVRDTLNAFALVLVDEFLRGNLHIPPPDSNERSEVQ